jgi:hypothetical protein
MYFFYDGRKSKAQLNKWREYEYQQTPAPVEAANDQRFRLKSTGNSRFFTARAALGAYRFARGRIPVAAWYIRLSYLGAAFL